MKKLSPLLLLIWVAYFIPHLAKADLLCAQQTANISFGSAVVEEGSTVCLPFQLGVDLKLQGVEIYLNWDSDILQFSALNYPPSFTNIGYNLKETSEGYGFFPIDVNACDTLFNLCFNIIGEAGESSLISFDTTNRNFEIINNDVELVPFEIASLSSISVVENAPSPALPFDGECFRRHTIVWPGDTNQDSLVNHFDILNIGLAFDSLGPSRPNASIDWKGEPNAHWFSNVPNSNVNLAHVDCNGDGHINAMDTLAILQNWEQRVESFLGNNEEDNPISAQEGVPFYIEPQALIEGESVDLNVILGEEDQLALDVYGLAFTLRYDPELVVEGSAYFDPENSWLGTLGEDMIFIQKDFSSDGMLKVGITRIDGQPITGFGNIGTLSLTIEEDILFKRQGHENRSGLNMKLGIENVQLISSNGQAIPAHFVETESEITTSVKETILTPKDIRVFPNPSHGQLNIETKQIIIEAVKVYTLNGMLISIHEPQSPKIQLNTSDWQNGLYLIKVQTKDGVLSQRIMITQ